MFIVTPTNVKNVVPSTWIDAVRGKLDGIEAWCRVTTVVRVFCEARKIVMDVTADAMSTKSSISGNRNYLHHRYTKNNETRESTEKNGSIWYKP